MIHSRILIREVGWKDVKETPAHISYILKSNSDDILISLNLLDIEWSIKEESKNIYVNKNDIILLKEVKRKQ